MEKLLIIIIWLFLNGCDYKYKPSEILTDNKQVALDTADVITKKNPSYFETKIILRFQNGIKDTITYRTMDHHAPHIVLQQNNKSGQMCVINQHDSTIIACDVSGFEVLSLNSIYLNLKNIYESDTK